MLAGKDMMGTFQLLKRANGIRRTILDPYHYNAINFMERWSLAEAT